MKYTILHTGSGAIPGPEGPLGPFELADVPGAWLRRHNSHRVKTPEEYDDMLAGMGHRELVDHTQARRQRSGEELSASGSAPSLRAQLSFTDRFEEDDD